MYIVLCINFKHIFYISLNLQCQFHIKGRSLQELFVDGFSVCPSPGQVLQESEEDLHGLAPPLRGLVEKARRPRMNH